MLYSFIELYPNVKVMSRWGGAVPVMGRVKAGCSRPRCWLTWDRN